MDPENGAAGRLTSRAVTTSLPPDSISLGKRSKAGPSKQSVPARLTNIGRWGMGVINNHGEIENEKTFLSTKTTLTGVLVNIYRYVGSLRI